MATNYGEGGYGLTPYGGATDSIDTAADLWPSRFLPFFRDTNHYKILRALLAPAESFTGELLAVQDAVHISTATGTELEKLGELVGVNRRDAEGDDKLRQRIILTVAAGLIEPTTDNVARYVRKLYEATYSDFTFSLDATTPVLTVQVDSTVQSNSAFTVAESEALIERTVPAGHAVTVTTV